MIINCNDTIQITELLYTSNYDGVKKAVFRRGLNSNVLLPHYNRYEGVIVVSDDSTIVNEVPVIYANNDNRIYQCDIIKIVSKVNSETQLIDMWIIKESDFIDMINEHEPFALDALKYNSVKNKFGKYFNLDKTKLLSCINFEAKKCWNYGKERIESGDKTFIGIEYLFESIRVQKYAIDLLKNKTNPYEYSSLFIEMKDELEAGNDWNFFETKYRPMYEKANETLVSLTKKKTTSRKKKNDEEQKQESISKKDEEQKEEGVSKKSNKVGKEEK